MNALRVLGIVGALLCFGWTANAQTEEETVFTFVEKAPEFPGGQEGLYKYLAENIEYPDMARELGVMGTVYVQFVVEKDGSVSNISIARGVHKTLDKEAMRVIRMMPKWKPGVQRGEAVRTQFTLPIKFILAGGPSKKYKEEEEKQPKWWQFWK